MKLAITSSRAAFTLPPGWVPVFVFLATLIIFVLVFHTYFSTPRVPLADSASNAMLVLDAKRFALLHGNYSRVGFYHPGPHLLYLMAAGEFLFHDLLGIAKSAEAAQLLAVICLSIAILLIVERVYRDLAGDVLISLSATAATVFCVVLMLPEAFTSMWVPYTYVTAALLFFLGGAALIAGHFKWLWAIVLGAAMLMSAHASFLGLVPLMGFILIGAVFIVRPEVRSVACIRILAAHHWGAVIASLVIVAVLLLPLVLQFALHFPGEFGKYLAFAKSQPAKPWGDVAGVLLSHWKFAWVAIGVFLAASLINPFDAASAVQRKQIVAAALAVFVAATVATIFYLQKGLDVIAGHSLYVVWWYQAAPATCVGLAVVYAGMGTTKRLPFFAIFVVLISAALWLTQWPSPAIDDSANVERTISLLRQKSRESGRPVRLALDAKDSLYFDVWARVVALLAEQERRGLRIVCIEGYDWHISYHERNRCPPANPKQVQTRLVASYDNLAPIGAVEVSTFMGLRLYDIKPADWPLDRIRSPWVGLSEHAAEGTRGSADPIGAAR